MITPTVALVVFYVAAPRYDGGTAAGVRFEHLANFHFAQLGGREFLFDKTSQPPNCRHIRRAILLQNVNVDERNAFGLIFAHNVVSRREVNVLVYAHVKEDSVSRRKVNYFFNEA